MKTPIRAAALLLAFVLTEVAQARAKPVSYEWNGVERIVAIGDVHGAYDNFVALLKNTGLVDEKLRWIGGTSHLVQLGDVVDRGADSRKCMDLLMDLEKQAKKAGGHAHVLVGNHEAMNIVGLLDHTSPEELASYNDTRGRRAREHAFQAYFQEQRDEAKMEGRNPPSKRDARSSFDAEYLPGYFGHRLAFGLGGRYGEWIRDHNVAIRINGIVFSHGDFSEEISALGLEAINQQVRDELSGKKSLQDGLTFHIKGPLQYRGLSEVLLTKQQQQSHQERVDQILTNLGASRMVVGHTTTDGTIEPRFGGKHISVDTGMLGIYQGGHQVALEIGGDSLYAVHPGGRVPLPEYLDESNYFDYLEAVAARDPGNINVHRRLAEEFLKRDEHQRARQMIEQLIQIDKSLPVGYRRVLGDLHRELGDTEKARKEYLTFIAGLQSVIEANPDNPHIRNTLARFCLEHNLKLDLAAEQIAVALSLSPENTAFLLTRGRLDLFRRQFAEAARTLDKVVNAKNPGYEAFYYLGLSYLGLDDPDKARTAFEQALQKDPNRVEAREELRKLNRSSQPQGGGKKP